MPTPIELQRDQENVLCHEEEAARLYGLRRETERGNREREAARAHDAAAAAWRRAMAEEPEHDKWGWPRRNADEASEIAFELTFAIEKDDPIPLDE